MRLCGKKPVLERIKFDPGSIKNLYLSKKTDLSDIVKAAKKQGLDFESIEKDSFNKMCGIIHSQGVMAEIPEYQYTPFKKLMKDAENIGNSLVFLDGITDPQNLGSIMRNLACLGGFSLILPEHNSVEINETVLRVACGGENFIKVSKIGNSVRGVKEAKERGFVVAGTVTEGGADILKTTMESPLAIVIGAEGKGIRPGLLQELDIKVTFPMPGAGLSYNAAVATALFCYEINRRKWVG
jgi:23S rRNA (guanosine2251-2'-O)-methyltransferase